MTQPIDHDQLFKQLLETFFVDFIELFAPALTTYLDLSQLVFQPQQYFTDIIDGDRKAIDVLTFNFQSIQLNRLNWRDFLQHQNPIAAALMAKMQIAKKDRPRVKVECLRLLANLQLDPARNFLISGFVDTYLRLNQKEEKVFQAEIAKIGTVTEQEKVMELTTSWMERGIEKGLEQERRSAISGLLELRYGSIDEQLAAIFPQLMTLTSIEYTPLIFQLSKQELIAHFRSAQN
jgi:hypothetical protein